MAELCTVRRAQPADAAALLSLMRDLASFEGYLEQFRVTEEDLLARGLQGGEQAQFTAFVADNGNGRLTGYAVVYVVPYTYDLRPNLMLKELYVDASQRGAGVGHALMDAVIGFGQQSGCARLKWDVLASNAPARQFYRSLGGAHDARWEGWLRAL